METYSLKRSIKCWEEADRPREKLLKLGPKTLSEAELLAILLGSGTSKLSAVDLSRNILQRANQQLDQLARLRVDELLKIHGVGPAKAVSIKATFELATRWRSSQTQIRASIRSSQDAFEQIQAQLFDLEIEAFYILLLNRANRVIDRIQISQGGVSGTVVDAKLIFQKALDRLSSSIILIHNHPSGNLNPSENDKIITKKLVAGAKLLDMHVIDHLIVYNDQYFSFADEGLI